MKFFTTCIFSSVMIDRMNLTANGSLQQLSHLRDGLNTPGGKEKLVENSWLVARVVEKMVY